MFVGFACIGIFDNERMSVHSIEDCLEEVGELPAWIVEQRDNTVIVHYLSMCTDFFQFDALEQSGFLGTDHNLRYHKNSCDPLFKLLHIHPENYKAGTKNGTYFLLIQKKNQQNR